MALHRFICPEVHLQGNARLRAAPERLAAYPSQLAMLADFDAGAVFAKTPSGQITRHALPPEAGRRAFPDHRGHRNVMLIAQLKGRIRGAITANMADATPFAPALYLGEPVNLFQYNRRRGDRSAVLWRLPDYFEPSPRIGALPAPLPADSQPFREKLPKLFWRGSMYGTRWTTSHETETLRAEWLADPGPGRVSALAARFSRMAAVRFSQRHPDLADCRFTPGDPAPGAALPGPEDPLFAPVVAPQDQLGYRFLLCPAGQDVSTQLYWALQTNCLVLKEETPYEVLPDYFLEPWLHYVPVAPGLTDLREKLEFCRTFRKVGEAIVARAQEAWQRMIQPEPWREAEDIVLDRLGLLD